MPITEEDRKRMGTPHPELLAALEKFPFPDLSHGNPNATVQEVRKNRAEHLARLRDFYPIPGPIPDLVREVDHHVTARDGHSIPVKIYTPAAAAATSTPPASRPLIVMFHEGGWRMGDVTDEDQNCRLFARDLGAVCINVAYRLAPEHRFPLGINDAYDAVAWAAHSPTSSSSILPANPATAGFIVGGASAGGNFAAVVAQSARAAGLAPPLTGQYLCVPALLDASVVPARWTHRYRSRAESLRDPVIKPDPATSQRRRDVLGIERPEDVRYSPLLAERLKGLPRAYFQIAGLDPLRDEGMMYEEELRGSGVETRMDVYDGFGHMSWTNWPEMKRSREFVADTLEGMRWLIEQHQRS